MPTEGTPRSSAYWLDKAEEARSIAEGMHELVAARSLLLVASYYEVMAKRAAQREGRKKLR
jgi:hypothetical protein